MTVRTWQAYLFVLCIFFDTVVNSWRAVFARRVIHILVTIIAHRDSTKGLGLLVYNGHRSDCKQKDRDEAH
jgi:hypothetical protein